LFALWFTTRTEGGREMSTAASRLKAGTDDWTEADVLFNAPTRNQTGSSLFNNRNGKLYWFNGLSAYQGYRESNALIMSTSDDNGMTWAHPKLINQERNDHERVNQPIDNIDSVMGSTIREDGSIIIYSDTRRLSGGGTALIFINLEEETVEFSAGTIAGIHARAVKLNDGNMLAVGRSLTKTEPDDKLPMSISRDRGETWEHFDSEFPAIAGGQRSVLLRLQEGPVLLVSFTGRRSNGGRGMLFQTENGQEFPGYGMFGALSYDGGETWPIRKLITPADGKTYNGEGHTKNFTATFTHAEPQAYLTATQTPDGIIQLFSSGLHYSFNMEWIMAPPTAP
jgi:formylglycine-generating enzyme